MGRGTATFDGLSLAWATVEYLHAETGARTLFATHYHELTMLAEKLPRRAQSARRVKEAAGGIVFLHTVEPGAASKSYGIEVAKLAGLPAVVIERARQSEGSMKSRSGRGASGGNSGADAVDYVYAAVAADCGRIEAADVNALTPLQALNLLAELQQELKETRNRDSENLRYAQAPGSLLVVGPRRATELRALWSVHGWLVRPAGASFFPAQH